MEMSQIEGLISQVVEISEEAKRWNPQPSGQGDLILTCPECHQALDTVGGYRRCANPRCSSRPEIPIELLVLGDKIAALTAQSMLRHIGTRPRKLSKREILRSLLRI